MNDVWHVVFTSVGVLNRGAVLAVLKLSLRLLPPLTLAEPK